MKGVTIWTDGACSPNPGRGGAAAILIYKGRERVISQTYWETTNNRAEMNAAIIALDALKEPCNVKLYSDSQLLVSTMTKGWKRKKNQDLWKRLDELTKTHSVQFEWVRGHSGIHENERVDALADQAMRSNDTIIDDGYLPLENDRVAQANGNGRK